MFKDHIESLIHIPPEINNKESWCRSDPITKSIAFSGTAPYKSQIYPIHSMGEEKTEEESKTKDEESKEEEMKVKEAVDTEDTQNESESTEKTTETEKAEQLVLFTEK